MIKMDCALALVIILQSDVEFSLPVLTAGLKPASVENYAVMRGSSYFFLGSRIVSKGRSEAFTEWLETT